MNIAYHLWKLGRRDIVLLEKGEIASGESSHAAGVVTQFATSKTMMQFRKYSIELYSELGLFNHVGSLRVASSREQLKELPSRIFLSTPFCLLTSTVSQSKIRKVLPAEKFCGYEESNWMCGLDGFSRKKSLLKGLCFILQISR